MVTYLTRFQWDLAKYPIKQSLKNIAEIIGKVRHTSFFPNAIQWILHFFLCRSKMSYILLKLFFSKFHRLKQTWKQKPLHTTIWREIYRTWKESPRKLLLFDIHVLGKQFEVIHNKCVSYSRNACQILLCFRGSLFTRNLTELVKREDFVLDSEYLQTLLVVVPK